MSTFYTVYSAWLHYISIELCIWMSCLLPYFSGRIYQSSFSCTPVCAYVSTVLWTSCEWSQRMKGKRYRARVAPCHVNAMTNCTQSQWKTIAVVFSQLSLSPCTLIICERKGRASHATVHQYSVLVPMQASNSALITNKNHYSVLIQVLAATVHFPASTSTVF